MSNYRMTLIVGGREINIPVLPAKLNVSSPEMCIRDRAEPTFSKEQLVKSETLGLPRDAVAAILKDVYKRQPFRWCLFHIKNSRTRPATRRNRKACGSHDKHSGKERRDPLKTIF